MSLTESCIRCTEYEREHSDEGAQVRLQSEKKREYRREIKRETNYKEL